MHPGHFYANICNSKMEPDLIQPLLTFTFQEGILIKHMLDTFLDCINNHKTKFNHHLSSEKVEAAWKECSGNGPNSIAVSCSLQTIQYFYEILRHISILVKTFQHSKTCRSTTYSFEQPSYQILVVLSSWMKESKMINCRVIFTFKGSSSITL